MTDVNTKTETATKTAVESSDTGYETEVQSQVKTIEDKDSKLDDLGYEKVPSEPAATTKEQTKEPPKEEPKTETVEDSTTGYGDAEPKAPEEKEPAKKETDPKTETETVETEKIDLGDTKGLLESEVAAIKDLVIKNKLSPEATKSLVEYEKAKVAKYEKLLKDKQEKAKASELETKKKWFNELKADPDFGGEAFGANVKKVDKMINDFMPNVKKQLTTSKGMLPPYIMRDLHNISKKLYGSEKFVQGEAPEVEDKNKKDDDPLAFYNS